MPAARAVVVLCDALPTRLLGCYGGEAVDTPGLDQFAHDSVVFDQFFADPAVQCHAGVPLDAAAVLAGLPNVRWLSVDAQAVPNAAASLAREDILLPSGASAELIAHAAALLAAENDDEPAPLRLFAAALEAAEELRAAPGVLVIEAAFLGPWAPPAEDRGRHSEDEAAGSALIFSPPGRVGELYSAADLERARAGLADRLAYFDMALGTLLAGIGELALPDCTVAVVGARGLPLGEHGRWGLGWGDLLPEELHAALVVRRPGCRAGARRPELVVPADLPELLLGPNAALGPPDRERAWLALRCGPSAALVAHDWKCVRRGPALALFERPADRWETNDLARPLLDRCETLAAALDYFLPRSSA